MKQAKKHKLGKFYLKDTYFNHYNCEIDGIRTQGWTEFKKSYSRTFLNRNGTGQIHTESVHYHDNFDSALSLLLRIPRDWADGIVIYKATPHKNVKCMSYPKTEKTYNNLAKYLNRKNENN